MDTFILYVCTHAPYCFFGRTSSSRPLLLVANPPHSPLYARFHHYSHPLMTSSCTIHHSYQATSPASHTKPSYPPLMSSHLTHHPCQAITPTTHVKPPHPLPMSSHHTHYTCQATTLTTHAKPPHSPPIPSHHEAITPATI